MKVALKPEYQIVESCSLVYVLPVGADPKQFDCGWRAIYAPALGEGTNRPVGMVGIKNPRKIGSTNGKACNAENWQVVAHKQFSARGWPSPWQVVR